MGLRGPAKKPQSLELAEGSPGKRALNDAAPQFAPGEPAMPTGLSPQARKIWRETIPLLIDVPGLITVVDGAVLADYCQVRADKLALEYAIRMEQARAVKREQERMLQTDMGLLVGAKDEREHATKIRADVFARSAGLLNQLRHQENALRREIGLSPSARSSLRITGTGGAKADAVDSALFSRPKLTKLKAVQ